MAKHDDLGFWHLPVLQTSEIWPSLDSPLKDPGENACRSILKATASFQECKGCRISPGLSLLTAEMLGIYTCICARACARYTETMC